MGTTTTANYGWVKPDGNEPASNWPSQWGSSVDDIDFEVDAINDRLVTAESQLSIIRNHIASFQHATGAQNSLSTGDNPEVILNWTLKTGWPASGTSGISHSSGEFTIANAGLYAIDFCSTVGSTVDTVGWTASIAFYINPTISAGLITAGTPFAFNTEHHVGLSGNNSGDTLVLHGASQFTAGQKLVVAADLLSYGAGGGNFDVPDTDAANNKTLSIVRLQ